MEYEMQLDRVLFVLAEKFYNDEPSSTKPEQSTYVASLRKDLREMLSEISAAPIWDVWGGMQTWSKRALNRESQKEGHRKMEGGEICFVAEVALHQHLGGHSLVMPWETMERISGWKIDLNIKTADLVSARLPDSLWVEFTSQASINAPPWAKNTVGILISRLMFLDAPADVLRNFAGPLIRDNEYEIELIRTLALAVCDGIPSLGYRIFIVQKTHNGYRYIISLMGNEQRGELVDMLQLVKEVSDHDKRKIKETQQLWCNIAIRVLLFAAHRRLFQEERKLVHLDEAAVAEYEAKNHAFFAQKAGEKTRIAVRPEYHVPFRPFRIEGAK